MGIEPTISSLLDWRFATKLLDPFAWYEVLNLYYYTESYIATCCCEALEGLMDTYVLS